MSEQDGAASLVRSDALLARIEKLRDEWAYQAWGIERTHGDDDPGGKAIRGCIGDLARAVEEVRSAPVRPARMRPSPIRIVQIQLESSP